nr:lipocalin family protein [Variovorax dokdonensis]
MEWWYYSGILDGQSNQRWAFHVAVFVVNGLIKHTVMHAALTDLATGRRYTAQSRTGGLPARPDGGGFDFRATGWSLSGVGPAHRLRFDDIGGNSLSLELLDTRPVVAHRAAGSNTPGLLDFGDSGISYYYSRPRMAASGSVRSAGREHAVRGVVWFDHQWGEFDVGRLGWSWFAIHLVDGSDLMVYQLFDRQGRPVTTTGTTVRPDGTARPLASDELTLQPTRRWTSPKTGVQYVLGWRLNVPWGEFEIDAMHDDSEFDAGTSSANLYWEGPIGVRGAQHGEGFLELSGYEHLKQARTP